MNKSKAEINKKYRENNKEKISLSGARYYKDNIKIIKEKKENNKEIIKEKQKAYYQINKIKIKEKSLKYRLDNPDKTKEYRETYKKTRNEKRNLRKKEDFLFKSKERIRKAILKSFKKSNFKKTDLTENILGCSFEDFKLYLESKFEFWMNWENHGLYNGELNYGWDIDHKIPLSTAMTEEDVIRLNHYTNLQPLCSKFNRDIKRDKFS